MKSTYPTTKNANFRGTTPEEMLEKTREKNAYIGALG